MGSKWVFVYHSHFWQFISGCGGGNELNGPDSLHLVATWATQRKFIPVCWLAHRLDLAHLSSLPTHDSYVGTQVSLEPTKGCLSWHKSLYELCSMWENVIWWSSGLFFFLFLALFCTPRKSPLLLRFLFSSWSSLFGQWSQIWRHIFCVPEQFFISQTQEAPAKRPWFWIQICQPTRAQLAIEFALKDKASLNPAKWMGNAGGLL